MTGAIIWGPRVYYGSLELLYLSLACLDGALVGLATAYFGDKNKTSGTASPALMALSLRHWAVSLPHSALRY